MSLWTASSVCDEVNVFPILILTAFNHCELLTHFDLCIVFDPNFEIVSIAGRGTEKSTPSYSSIVDDIKRFDPLISPVKVQICIYLGVSGGRFWINIEIKVPVFSFEAVDVGTDGNGAATAADCAVVTGVSAVPVVGHRGKPWETLHSVILAPLQILNTEVDNAPTTGKLGSWGIHCLHVNGVRQTSRCGQNTLDRVDRLS